MLVHGLLVLVIRGLVIDKSCFDTHGNMEWSKKVVPWF